MPDDAAAFRAECIEAMAKLIDPLAFEAGRTKPRGYEMATDAQFAKIIALRRRRARRFGERVVTALTTVAEKHGLKLLGRENGAGPIEQTFNAMHDAAVSLLEGPK